MHMLTVPLFLCGLPTVGKTTFGNGLAKYLHLPFFDTDSLITQCFASPYQLFSHSETLFRLCEAMVLQAIPTTPSVVALGGSTPLSARALPWLHRGKLILLTQPIPNLLPRLSGDRLPLSLRSQPLLPALKKRLKELTKLADASFPIKELTDYELFCSKILSL